MFNAPIDALAWVLAFFFDLTHSYGVSIILLTIAVMAVVTPLTLKGTRSMMAMQRLQPEMRRIQQECAGDRQRLNEEMLAFYRENDINPMGSCLPLLIQMPIFLVLFRVVKGITRIGSDGTFDPNHLSVTTAMFKALDKQREMLFLGFDLESSPKTALIDRGFIVALPYLVLVALWVGTSYLQQMQVAGRNPDAMTPQQKMMMRVIPIFLLTAVFFPAALSIYWVTSNLCRVATQGYISHRFYDVGGLGLGRKRGDEGEGGIGKGGAGKGAIDVPAKPAKPNTPKATPKKEADKSGSGKTGDGAKKERPATGRVTPAKNASTKPTNGRTTGAPGRRTDSSSKPSGERTRRRVPNGPPPGDAAANQTAAPRKKWRI